VARVKQLEQAGGIAPADHPRLGAQHVRQAGVDAGRGERGQLGRAQPRGGQSR